jgi:hypothetical protein
MRTVTYKSVQDAVAGFLGWDANNLSRDDQAVINRHLNRRLQFAWEAFWWPELTVCEKRLFRVPWDAVTNFTATTQVYDFNSQAYYIALQAGANHPPTDANLVVNLAYWALAVSSYNGSAAYVNTTAYVQGNTVYYPPTDSYYQLYAATSTGNLPTDTTKWGVIVPFERTIDYVQSGKTVIGELKQAWSADPRATPNCARRLQSYLQDNGVRIGGTETVVWLEFRQRTPGWTGAVYTSGTYAAGTQVYWTDGDYYQATTSTSNPPSTTSDWTRINLPYVLSKYAAQGAYADTLGKSEGKPEQLPGASDEAFAVLEFEWDKIERQQAQDSQLNVITSTH